MGGISSKEIPSEHLQLQHFDSPEQFSVWETTLSSMQNGNDPTSSSFVDQQHTFSIPVTENSHLKLRFFLKESKQWHDGKMTGCFGTRGASLWVAVSSGHDQTFVFSIKARKTVNGEKNEEMDDCTDATLHHRHVCVHRKCSPGNGNLKQEILLEEQFLVLGILRKIDSGLEKEIPLYSRENGLIKLKVNFAVKMMYGNMECGSDHGNGDMEGYTPRGNAKKYEGATYLAKDLKKLYSGNNMSSDIVLKSMDGLTVNAHKVILAARSPYFQRLIQWSPSAVARGTPVVIDTVNSKPLLAVVHWMYSGELLEDVGNFLEEMIQAAAKFEMSDLLKILEKRRLLHGSGSNCSSCNNGRKVGAVGIRKFDSVRKFKRVLFAWFPLLRYRFGHRPVGLVASIINAIYGIYELF